MSYSKPLPPDTPEAAALREWLEKTVVPDDGYHTTHLGEAVLLYESDYKGGFLAALIDGLKVERPPWAGATAQPSKVFFQALSTYLTDVPSHLVQLLGHDASYWEIRRINRVTPDVRHLPWILSLLHREPADEAGSTYIMLLADDKRSAIVLADNPYVMPPYNKCFCIVFHGDAERKESFQAFLRQALMSAESA